LKKYLKQVYNRL